MVAERSVILCNGVTLYYDIRVENADMSNIKQSQKLCGRKPKGFN